jgi:hypothetical protein
MIKSHNVLMRTLDDRENEDVKILNSILYFLPNPIPNYATALRFI